MSYINELDSIQRFIDESCVIDENEKVLVSVIKDSYNKFCVDENIPAVKPSQLKDTLSRKFEIKKNNNNYYYGFKLKDNEVEEESSSNKFGLD
jgi:hypothetical protein